MAASSAEAQEEHDKNRRVKVVDRAASQLLKIVFLWVTGCRHPAHGPKTKPDFVILIPTVFTGLPARGRWSVGGSRHRIRALRNDNGERAIHFSRASLVCLCASDHLLALLGHGSSVRTLIYFLRQELDSIGLRVVAEGTPDKVLLVTKIFEEEVFQRQGGCIFSTMPRAHVPDLAQIKANGSLSSPA
jgi:hypothetical protein